MQNDNARSPKRISPAKKNTKSGRTTTNIQSLVSEFVRARISAQTATAAIWFLSKILKMKSKKTRIKVMRMAQEICSVSAVRKERGPKTLGNANI
jgi:hypothetical protein